MNIGTKKESVLPPLIKDELVYLNEMIIYPKPGAYPAR